MSPSVHMQFTVEVRKWYDPAVYDVATRELARTGYDAFELMEFYLEAVKGHHPALDITTGYSFSQRHDQYTPSCETCQGVCAVGTGARLR